MDKAVLQSYNCIKIHTKETKVMAQNVKDSTDMIRGSIAGGGDIPVFWRRPDGADAPGHPQFPGSYGNPERFVYSTGLKLYKAFAPRHRRTRGCNA